jgi:hypothetical protein
VLCDGAATAELVGDQITERAPMASALNLTEARA